jgi:hypothetical protein
LIEGLLLQNELFDEITGLAGASVLLTSTVIPGEEFVVEKRKAINEIKVLRRSFYQEIQPPIA